MRSCLRYSPINVDFPLPLGAAIYILSLNFCGNGKSLDDLSVKSNSVFNLCSIVF